MVAGASAVEVAADGVTKQQASVRPNANAVERNAKPVAQVSDCLTYSLGRDLARVWEQYNQSHFRAGAEGLHRGA